MRAGEEWSDELKRDLRHTARGLLDRTLVRALAFHHAGVNDPELAKFMYSLPKSSPLLQSKMSDVAVEVYTDEALRRWPGGLPFEQVLKFVPELRQRAQEKRHGQAARS